MPEHVGDAAGDVCGGGSGAAAPAAAADIVTLGEAMRLLVAEPGVALRRAESFRASIAGAETNVAIGLSRLGHRVRWLSRVGADAAGSALLAHLRAEGVDVSAVEVDPDRHTGLLMRDSHASRPVQVQYFRAGSAASALSPSYVRSSGLAGARLVHVTGITAMLSDPAREAVHALLAAAREQGAAVSFDPNVRHRLGPPDRWRAVAGPLLGEADLVFAGADELELITGLPSAQATGALLAGGTHTVLVKHPDKSATVTTTDGTWREPSRVPTVVDAVGAGDALVVGYLDAWLRDAPPAAALLAGVVTAALVVGAVTDTEGLPDRAELDHAVGVLTEGGEHLVDR